MSTKFYPLKVKDVRQETFDTVSVQMDVPEELRDTFQYNQGQYLNFKLNDQGEEIRRSYSLCSSPLDQEWRVAIKKVPGGRFSTYANDRLKEGDVLEVMPPMGRFYTPLAVEQNKHYVFFAAGSGITPIHSIIKTVLQVESKSRVTLFYGNKNSTSIIFKDSLEALKNLFIGRLAIHYFLSREKMDAELFQGRIDTDKCNALLNCFPQIKNGDEYFLCGPLEMIESAKTVLIDAGVDKSKIHFELFTSPTQSNDIVQNKHVAVTASEAKTPKSQVTVKVDGISFDFELPYEGSNILDAAMHKGADLPFSCKGGVCSTCRAKLMEGVVDMDVNYALEEDEVEDGFILTCQSRPRSERIVIDFDQ